MIQLLGSSLIDPPRKPVYSKTVNRCANFVVASRERVVYTTILPECKRLTLCWPDNRVAYAYFSPHFRAIRNYPLSARFSVSSDKWASECFNNRRVNGVIHTHLGRERVRH